MFRGNAAAGIPDNDFESVAGLLASDREDAACRHGVPRIRREIKKQLLEVSLSHHDIRESFQQLNLQFDTLPLQPGSKNGQCTVECAPQIGLSAAVRCAARECEHSAKDPAAGLARLSDLFE